MMLALTSIAMTVVRAAANEQTRSAEMAAPYVTTIHSALGAPPRFDHPMAWGPLSAEACVPALAGFRTYRAPFIGASTVAGTMPVGAGDCTVTANNVMGAHFPAPERCEQVDSTLFGVWHVHDTSCGSADAVLPARGADDPSLPPLEGFADLHNHLLAHLAFGGSVISGQSWGEPEQALAPMDARYRRAHWRVQGLFVDRSLAGLFHRHAEQGFPSFDSWPGVNMATHQQTYVQWLFRAYQGGLRLVVALANNNEDMFGRGENRLTGLQQYVVRALRPSPLPSRTANDMEALEMQFRGAHELAAWVRERSDGAPWLEIATSPEAASTIISAGRLAVVLGSEVDHLFNCDLGRRCDEARVREGLDKLAMLGVAVIFPTHWKRTQFGGAALVEATVSNGEQEACAAYTKPCSAVGLTALGKYLVREAMRRGMLIDLGHAGRLGTDDALTLMEEAGYPPLVSHGAPYPLSPNGASDYALTWPNLSRIAALRGMVAVQGARGEYAGAGNDGSLVPLRSRRGAGAIVQSYLYLKDAMNGGLDNGAGLIGFGPDFNGFAGLPAGRCAQGCNGASLPNAVTYPFELPWALVRAAVQPVEQLPLYTFGPDAKAFDFNLVGLAHAGMMPDLLEDMRQHGLAVRDLEPLYRSARGFVETWRRARAALSNEREALRWVPQSPTDLVRFDYLNETMFVQVAPDQRLCRVRKTKQLGVVTGQNCVSIGGAAPSAPEVLLLPHVVNANSGQCLAAETPVAARSAVVQRPCDDTPTWYLRKVSDGWWLMTADGLDDLDGLNNSGASRASCVTELTGARHTRASRVGVRACAETLATQRWSIEVLGNTFRLRNLGSGRCLHVDARGWESGAAVMAAECPPPGRADFHWEIDALRAEVDFELLLHDGAQRVVWRPRVAAAAPDSLARVLGSTVCRASADGAIGIEREDGCAVAADGVHRRTLDYEVLTAADQITR